LLICQEKVSNIIEIFLKNEYIRDEINTFRRFYEMTKIQNRVDDLQIIFMQEGIRFSHASSWEALAKHVEVHRYFLGKQLDFEISWDDALFSWYENILIPLKRVVSTWSMKSAFPTLTLGDLYLAVSDHWFYLKEENEEISSEEAAKSFIQHYGEGLARWFSKFLLPGTISR
jgi:hypothetical protein